MKKILSIILFGAALFGTTSCVSEEELLFDKTAAERLNEASDAYSKRILASPHGWALEYFPHSSTDEDLPLKGSGFLMLTKFDADKSVLVGMNNVMSGSRYREDRSVWEVITDNGPVLSFNSHNECLHAFSEPEDIPSTSENETGKGLEGDYEFVMVDVPEGGDYILLKGKKRGAYSRLTKLDEETDFEEYISDVTAMKNKLFPADAPNCNYLNVGNSKYQFIMDQIGGKYGLVKMWPEGTDSTFTKVIRPMVITRHGVKGSYTYNMRFRGKIQNDEEAEEQEFVYNPANDTFNGVNAESNTIVGEDITSFLNSVFSAKHAYTLKRKDSQISDAVAAVMDNVYNSYHSANSKYGITDYSMTYDDEGNIFVKCRYNPNDSKTELQYKFKSTLADQKLTLEYVGPANERSENHFDRVSEMLTTVFSQAFNVTPGKTKYNLSVLRLTSVADTNIWFDIIY